MTLHFRPTAISIIVLTYIHTYTHSYLRYTVQKFAMLAIITIPAMCFALFALPTKAGFSASLRSLTVNLNHLVYLPNCFCFSLKEQIREPDSPGSAYRGRYRAAHDSRTLQVSPVLGWDFFLVIDLLLCSKASRN